MASQCSNEGDESSNVGLKELFDATHMIKTKSGMKKYVNAKARKNAVHQPIFIIKFSSTI
jgi:hypothetical protein